MHKTIITKSDIETNKAGEKFAKRLKSQDVVLLYGDLGSGKTTFVKGLAKGLGVVTRVISPTFVILRTHNTSKKDIKKLYHLDLYRLKNPEELEALELKDYLNDKNGVTVIEWPETAISFIKKHYAIEFLFAPAKNPDLLRAGMNSGKKTSSLGKTPVKRPEKMLFAPAKNPDLLRAGMNSGKKTSSLGKTPVKRPEKMLYINELTRKIRINYE